MEFKWNHIIFLWLTIECTMWYPRDVYSHVESSFVSKRGYDTSTILGHAITDDLKPTKSMTKTNDQEKNILLQSDNNMAPPNIVQVDELSIQSSVRKMLKT